MHNNIGVKNANINGIFNKYHLLTIFFLELESPLNDIKPFPQHSKSSNSKFAINLTLSSPIKSNWPCNFAKSFRSLLQHNWKTFYWNYIHKIPISLPLKQNFHKQKNHSSKLFRIPLNGGGVIYSLEVLTKNFLLNKIEEYFMSIWEKYFKRTLK